MITVCFRFARCEGVTGVDSAFRRRQLGQPVILYNDPMTCTHC